MTGPAPSFMRSEYYDSKNNAMKEDATEELKKAYEEYWNDEETEDLLREDYPEFEHPFRSWTGKIVEKSERLK